MGTFEKLGILVIVVIIVMILAVAIYQWGGPPADAAFTSAVSAQEPPRLEVKPLEEYGPRPERRADDGEEEWDGAVPRTYTIERNDKLWVLVVRRWGLTESFIQAVVRANPGVDVERLKPGETLTIPDPAPFRKTDSPARTRSYEIQVGDTLESIAKAHLGEKTRWNEILALNPGLDPKRLRLGARIALPAR